MSNPSCRLRNSDIRTVYLLLGECCELGADPLVWRQHMLLRINEIFSCVASSDIMSVLHISKTGLVAIPCQVASHGQITREQTTILSHCCEQMPLQDNPLGYRLSMNCPDNHCQAGHRRGWVSNRDWERCSWSVNYLQSLKWGDNLIGVVRKAKNLRLLNLARARGDSHFGARAGAVLQLFLSELEKISETRLSPMTQASLTNLSLRMRQVLLALAAGDNEKQIAIKLSISRSTVHEYVRRLYARYGVASRGELLVRAARQLHASKIVNE